MSGSAAASPNHQNDSVEPGKANQGTVTETIPDEGIRKNAFELDHSKTGTNSVPASADPEDIQAGLDSSPEMQKLASLESEINGLSESMAQTAARGKLIDPSDKEALKLHHEIENDENRRAVDLADRFSELTAATKGNAIQQGKQNQGQMMPSTKLHLPLIEKALEKIVEALKAIFEFIMRRLSALSAMVGIGSGPKEIGSGSGSSPGVKKLTDMMAIHLPNGGYTAGQVQNKFETAIEKGDQRLELIKEKNVEQAAALEQNADGPQPLKP